jgi:hypothetical protein
VRALGERRRAAPKPPSVQTNSASALMAPFCRDNAASQWTTHADFAAVVGICFDARISAQRVLPAMPRRISFPARGPEINAPAAAAGYFDVDERFPDESEMLRTDSSRAVASSSRR